MLGALCGRGLNLVRMKDNANEDKCKLQIQTKQQSFTHPIALTLGEKKSFSKKWASFKTCAGVRCLFHTTDTTTAFLSKISEESRRNTAARLSTLKCALNK